MGEARLPLALRTQIRLDRQGLSSADPGNAAAIEAALSWLCRAQDRTRSGDGGVSRDFSLLHGWASSYPETTGYIIPTFLADPGAPNWDELRRRARRMLDWLRDIQMPDGAIQGGKIDMEPVAPVPFNTGQVLMGFAAGELEFGQYVEPLRRAADWLVSVQEPDGSWMRHQSPFASPGVKTYDTHIAWGLLEAARIEPDRGYAESALANVHWTLAHQRENGWLDKCCLSSFDRPLTHTLGYALRGVLEAYRFTRDGELLAAARRTADGLTTALRPDGFLAGQLSATWAEAAPWACLTGTVQIAYCWLALYQETGDRRYLDAGYRANAYVRRSIAVDGPPDTRGAVRGSFPIDGAYCRYSYPNWAAKFAVDSLRLEASIRASHGAADLS